MKSNTFNFAAKPLTLALSAILLTACGGEDQTSANGLTANGASTQSSNQQTVRNLYVTRDIIGLQQCPNGGQEITSGFDRNNNNVLDEDEIAHSYIVCNGQDGQNGQDGVGIANVQIQDVSGVQHLIITLSNNQTIDAGPLVVNAQGQAPSEDYPKVEALLDGFKTWLQNVDKIPNAIQTESEAIKSLGNLYQNDANATLQSLSLFINALTQVYKDNSQGTSTPVELNALTIGDTDLSDATGTISYDTNNNTLTWQNITLPTTQNNTSITSNITNGSATVPARTGTDFTLNFNNLEVANTKAKVKIPTAQAHLVTTNNLDVDNNQSQESLGDTNLTLQLGNNDQPVVIENLPEQSADKITFNGQLNIELFHYQIETHAQQEPLSHFIQPKNLHFKGSLAHGDNINTQVDIGFTLTNPEEWRLSQTMIKGLDQLQPDGTIADFYTLTAIDKMDVFGDTSQYGFRQYDISGVNAIDSNDLSQVSLFQQITQHTFDQGLIIRDIASYDPGNLDPNDPNKNTFTYHLPSGEDITITKTGDTNYEWRSSITDENGNSYDLLYSVYNNQYFNSIEVSTDGNTIDYINIYMDYNNPNSTTFLNDDINGVQYQISSDNPESVYSFENVPYTSPSGSGNQLIKVYYNLNDGSVIPPSTPQVKSATVYQNSKKYIKDITLSNIESGYNYPDTLTGFFKLLKIGIDTNGDNEIDQWRLFTGLYQNGDGSYSGIQKDFSDHVITANTEEALLDSLDWSDWQTKNALGLNDDQNCYQADGNIPKFTCQLNDGYPGFSAEVWGEYTINFTNGLPSTGSTLSVPANIYEVNLNDLQQIETFDFNPKYTATASITLNGLTDTNNQPISETKLDITAKRNGVLHGSGGLEVKLSYNNQSFAINFSHPNLLTRQEWDEERMQNLHFSDNQGGEIVFENLSAPQVCREYDYNGSCYYYETDYNRPYKAKIYYNGIKHGYIYRDRYNRYGAQDSWIYSLKNGKEDILWSPTQH